MDIDDDVLTDDDMDRALRALLRNAHRPEGWQAAHRDLLVGVITGERDDDPASNVGAIVVPLGRRTAPRRWLAWAAAIAVVVVGGAVVAQRRAPDPIDEASPPSALAVPDASVPEQAQGDTLPTGGPTWPPLFPSLDPDDPDAAVVSAAHGQFGLRNPLKTSSVVGRLEGGALTDLAIISALDAAEFDSSMAPLYEPPVQHVVDGVTVTVYTGTDPSWPTTAIVSGEPTELDISVTAADPVSVIETLGVELATATTDQNGWPTLRLAPLPPGYVALDDPAVEEPGRSWPILTWGDADRSVSVQSGPPPVDITHDLMATEFGGMPAWFDPTSGTLMWRLQPGVWASVTVDGGLDDALELAARIRFVDQATWRQRYPSADQFFGADAPSASPPPSEPTTPIVTAAPTSTIPVTQRPPIAVGESVMMGAIPQLTELGFDVYAEEARQGEGIAEVIGQLRSSNQIGSAIVIQTGTNGPVEPETYDQIMSYLPADEVPVVVFLTVHADRGWIAPNNDAIRALPTRYPNVFVLDWEAQVTSGAIEGMAGDGIHLNRESSKQTYADLIASAVEAAAD